MAGYEREVKKYLKEAGCTFVRHGRGDHEVWFSPIVSKNFVVDGEIKSRHTANEVLKQAGIGKKF